MCTSSDLTANPGLSGVLHDCKGLFETNSTADDVMNRTAKYELAKADTVSTPMVYQPPILSQSCLQLVKFSFIDKPCVLGMIFTQQLSDFREYFLEGHSDKCLNLSSFKGHYMR